MYLKKAFALFYLFLEFNYATSQSYAKAPHLEILPNQSILKKPIGKSLILTCSPNVEHKDLINELKWRDSNNNTIMTKQFGSQPTIYTEYLNTNQLMLVIPSLTESLAGYFYCSASYANSELLEERIKIETFVGITWKDAPENQSPVVGSDYVVRCVVTANPPPTVDWLKNGESIKLSTRYIIKHDGLLIKDVNESDDGIYVCRAAVIQTGELQEKNIRLDVQTKPSIISFKSETYEAIEGEEFSIICKTQGKPPPLVQWIKDQKDVSFVDRFSVQSHNGQMNIARVEENDRGIYVCKAKNSAGYAEQKINLNVVVKPKIFELKNITYPINEEASIICKAKGRPPPFVSFRKWGSKEELRLGIQENDNRIMLDHKIDEDLGESTGTMIISKLVHSDDGLYQCVARNRGDTAFEVGHITVEYPPSFDHLKDLPPVFSWEERPANLSCFAMALPNATIEWRWNDKLIREMQDKFLQIVEEGPRSDLIVKPIERRYYTAYKCIAVNKLGRAEHNFELREARLPPAVAQAKPIEVTATTITFEIIGPAFEPGMPIKAYTAQYKEERNPDWNYAINRTWTPNTPYVVENLRPQTMYTFRFAARNDVGLGQWSAIRVQATPSRSVPEPPKILNHFTHFEEGELPFILSTYPDSFELIWNRPPDNGEPIDFYSIKYCPGIKVNNVWSEIERMCKELDFIKYTLSNFMIEELKHDTTYRVDLKAHNAIGFSASTSVFIKTSRNEHAEMFENEREEQFSLSSVTIIGLAVIGIIIVLIIIDAICCLTNELGILALVCLGKSNSSSNGYKKALIRDENQPLSKTQHDLVVEFSSDQSKASNSRSTGIGKNSAV